MIRSRRGHSFELLTTAFVSALAVLHSGCVGNRAPTSAPAGQVSPLRDSRQLVLVISDNWDATSAQLQCCERATPKATWCGVGEPIPVSIGRTGLAWGRGIHGQPLPPGPTKSEGDGKAPAGIFALPSAFGYAPKEQARDVKLPYLALTANIVGVDDVKSKYYNQIVRLGDVPAKDWDSFETMRRNDGLYEWGVVVNHNASPAVAGAGSCIFLHIWRGPGQPTAGCTAMSRENMVRLLQWLDPKATPVLVQLPRATYRELADRWGLPELR